ncbi:MAG: hypothetical protein ABFE07_22635 [Armatimonadia bacterium]
MTIYTDLKAARQALHDGEGCLLVNDDGSYTHCPCVPASMACKCRPAGYVESLAPSFDETQPENINKRPIAASEQADLFGA